MGADERAGTSPTSLTCFVASTPWAGSWRLCRLLGDDGGITTPSPWFDPLRVPYRSRQLAIPLGVADWAARYLEAVRAAATRNGICAVSLEWAHLRWLAQIARFALPPVGSSARPSLDPEVLAAWFPEPRFVWVGAADTASQALRWYAALHPELVGDAGREGPGGSGPDYQEVRWLEAIILRQVRAWTTFFRVHGIVPHPVDYDDLVAQQTPTVDSLLVALGIAPGRGGPGRQLVDGPGELRAARWLKPYRAVRPRLRTTVGVRSPAA